MAKVKSAKDILISKDFLEAREQAGKYISQEFQDYAYRLATDLGDIQHKAIYMKLAKTVDRTLLEQAAVFALSYYDEPNKGKLFMWKVQQLRRLAKQKQDKKNHDHDFVMQRMAEIIDELSGIYAAAQKRDHTSDTQEMLNMLAAEVMQMNGQSDPAGLRMLVVGCGIGLEAGYLDQLGFNTHGFDISRKLVKKAKANANNKMIRKPNLFEHKYKESYFHGVYVPARMWELVPQESEERFLTELQKLRHDQSCVAIQLSTRKDSIDSSESPNTQSWEEFDWQEQKYIRFKKYCSPSELAKRLNIANYKMLTLDTMLIA